MNSLKMKKPFSLAYVALAFCVSVLDATIFERTTSVMMRRVPATIPFVACGHRWQSGSIGPVPRGVPKGVYTQATEDAVFKHIMNDSEVRNSFLSGVIREKVVESELLDSSLNSVQSYTALRNLLNDPSTQKLMENIHKLAESINSGKKEIGVREKDCVNFLYRLSPLYDELVQAIPDRERNTQLDLICRTDTDLINVEVQVKPQNFWDIRILDHVCGLFHRQFTKGFRWSQLETDEDIRDKVKRVVGVSIFEKPPVSSSSVQALLPWYKLHSWAADELSRHYQLADTKDPSKKRGGIEFYDYNLVALKNLSESQVLVEGGEVLREWLDLLANAHLKSKEEVNEVAKLPAVKKAYKMLESGSLPEDVRKQYEEAQVKRWQISHYIEDEKSKAEETGMQKGIEKGIEKNKVDTALNMLKDGMGLDAIVRYTGLFKKEVEQIQKEFVSNK